MKIASKKLVLLIPALIITGMLSCTPGAKKQVYDIVWPLPPEKPRIKFVDMIYTNKDVEKSKSAFTELLVGPENVKVFMKPHSVYASAGRIYVSDVGKVFVFDTINQKFYFIGNSPGRGKLVLPIGISGSGDERVFVSDTSLDKIHVYDKKGKFITVIGRAGEFNNPSGLAIDNERKRLYVVDSKLHLIKVYSIDNYQYLMSIGSRGSEEGSLNFPTAAAVDSGGNLYVVDTGNHRIQKFDPEGNFILSFGSLGDRPGTFVRPKGIAVDSEDHIYVVDSAFGNVQIFSNEGRLLLFFGDNGTGPGQFFIPAGISIDRNDRIYVVDQLNKRLQIFQYLSEVEGKSENEEKNEDNVE